MRSSLLSIVFRLAKRKQPPGGPSPLLVELYGRLGRGVKPTYEVYPFQYLVRQDNGRVSYEIFCDLSLEQLEALRAAVAGAAEDLDPAEVDPLTFERLVEVMTQLSAEHLGPSAGVRTKELAELLAYEAIGLSRILPFAKDSRVTEFFVDSGSTPVYLDHLDFGRCETRIVLVDREREALATHLDTFRGYTPDFLSPSLKNEIEVSGARLRVSLDLEPLAVNGFGLDVRRLDVSNLDLEDLVRVKAISPEAGAFLVAWVELGGNCTIVGETGSGKTTLLNALDERIERRLRRLYIEDAVETRDLLPRGYHQMKVKVDPFDRGPEIGRTKGAEIVKALHRSPDIVILSEIQSEDHSTAFFRALASVARGMQTFHSSSIEQALRRWTNTQGVPEECLLDLGVMVQMQRPDRLRSERFVSRICQIVPEGGVPRIRELFIRGRDCALLPVADPRRIVSPPGVEPEVLIERIAAAEARIPVGGA